MTKPTSSRTLTYTQGLTLQGIRWAMTSFSASNWHPLTWDLYMLDCRLFSRATPLGYHLVNVLFHVLSTLLLFYVLRWITGFTWRSAAVALLFAIHPLHVESVAWVAERKDALSTFFWMLTLLGTWPTSKDRRWANIFWSAAFVLGLMAKPMLVSLPVTMLLLDIWPLGRFAAPGDKGGRRLIWEKVPFAALAAGSCVVTYFAQRSGGAVVELSRYPLGIRASNAVVTCVSYIVKMVHTNSLAMLYPHPQASLPTWQVAGSAFFLICVSALAVLARRKRPYILVGWLWYLITLVPVIGLVQVGLQAMADRYTYVPLTGLFIIIAWGVPDLLAVIAKPAGRSAHTSHLVYAAAAIMAAALAMSTYYQVGYWQNSITLFEHSLAVVKDNYLAYNNLGSAYREVGRTDDAIAQYREAMRIKPDYPYAQSNLGLILTESGKPEQGLPYILNAIKYIPGSAEVNNDLGFAYAQKGRVRDAIKYFKRAVELDPDNPGFRRNLATAQRERRRT